MRTNSISTEINSESIHLLDVSNYESFVKSSPFKGDDLYLLLVSLCEDSIKTKKPVVAAANLQKIFDATFKICAKSSFHAMSLRDLSAETGISMGGIYACISNKHDLLVMVKSLVRYCNDYVYHSSQAIESPQQQLEYCLRCMLYLTTQLQPWYFFLYVETHSMERDQLAESKQVELDSMQRLQSNIEQIGQANQQCALQTATVCLALQQEWYLKPWKYKQLTIDVDQYVEQTLETLNLLLK